MGELSRPSKIGLGVGLGIFLAGVVVMIVYLCGVFPSESTSAPVTPTPVTTVTVTPTPTKVILVSNPPIYINSSFVIPPPPNNTYPAPVATEAYPNNGFPNVSKGLIVRGVPSSQLMSYPCVVNLTSLSNTLFTVQAMSCNSSQTPDVGYSTGAVVSILQAPAVIAVCQINGMPAIAFHGPNSTNKNYQFLLATTSTGTAWETLNSNLFTVNSSGSVDGIGLAQISGYPSAFMLVSATEIYYARSTSGAYDFTSNTQFVISNSYTSALQGPLSTFVLNTGYLACACFSTSGTIALTSALVANPASSADFAIYYLGTSLARCGSMSLLGTYPAYVSVNASNIIFALSTVVSPTSNSSFSTPVTVIPSSLNLIPDANSIIRLTTISVNGAPRPMVLWMSLSNIYFTIATNGIGTIWPLTATALDPSSVQVTFDVVSLPSGNVGVAFVTSQGYVRYALIKGNTGQSLVTPIGASNANTSVIGVGLINSSPVICLSRAGNAYFISAGANNESFSDSVSVSYEAVGA